jgi:GNAT superfamily N-acetyltransferase
MEMSPAGVTLRFAEAADLATLGDFLPELGGAFFRERFPGKTARDFCEWKYFQNPLGPAVVGIAAAGDRVVSTAAAVPKPVQINGVRQLTYELGDFLTAADFRRRGLFSRLVNLVVEETEKRGAPLVYVRPNDTAFALLVKLGFTEPQQIHQRIYAVPGPLLARKLRFPAALSKSVGIDALGRRLLAPARRERGLEVSAISRFGPETDRLWEAARREYAFLLARESDYLNWRYADSPTPFQIWLARRGGRPVGFLIGFIGPEEGVAAILDLFAAPTDHAAAQALLHHAFREFHVQGMRTIYTWTLAHSADSAASRWLRRGCPFVRGARFHLAVRFARGSAPLRLPASGWHIGLGDFDSV